MRIFCQSCRIYVGWLSFVMNIYGIDLLGQLRKSVNHEQNNNKITWSVCLVLKLSISVFVFLQLWTSLREEFGKYVNFLMKTNFGLIRVTVPNNYDYDICFY